VLRPRRYFGRLNEGSPNLLKLAAIADADFSHQNRRSRTIAIDDDTDVLSLSWKTLILLAVFRDDIVEPCLGGEDHC
jgi:hypothetical protein